MNADMELRQLRYFVAVAEELHFGRAAERLHMSQPPLSTQVRRLEREIGADLLRRSTRRVTLTTAGEAFYARALSVLEALDAAVEEAREADAGRRGALRVGFVSSANFSVLPPAIRSFREDRPGVRLDLRPLPSSEQIAALHAGTIDLGLLRLPALGTGLRLETVLSEPFVVVVPRWHRLAERQALDISDFADEPMVLFPYQQMPGFVGQVLQMFDAAGRAPRIAQQAIHHETAIGLVAAGVGLSILPASAARISTPDVRCVPLSPSPQSELAIAVLPGAGSAAIDAFAERLHDAARTLATPKE